MDIMSGLMSNPDAVNQIKNILSGIQANDSQTPETSVKNDTKVESNNAVPDMSFLNNIFSGNNQNSEIMIKMKNAYDAYSNRNDPEINLLTALTPYLSTTRLQYVERMKTLVRIGKATSAFTKR